MNDIFYSLNDLENDCWLRLLNGSMRNKDDFHTATVGTSNGSACSMRTMVLRKVVPQQKQLHFNTDIRSNKWLDLEANKSISALFYNSKSRIQIRINGFATMHHKDEVADIAWQSTSVNSRKSFLAVMPPASLLEFPSVSCNMSDKTDLKMAKETENGRENFGIITIHTLSLDWLWLNHAVHQRAYFDYTNLAFSWIAP